MEYNIETGNSLLYFPTNLTSCLMSSLISSLVLPALASPCPHNIAATLKKTHQSCPFTTPICVTRITYLTTMWSLFCRFTRSHIHTLILHRLLHLPPTVKHFGENFLLLLQLWLMKKRPPPLSLLYINYSSVLTWVSSILLVRYVKMQEQGDSACNSIIGSVHQYRLQWSKKMNMILSSTSQSNTHPSGIQSQTSNQLVLPFTFTFVFIIMLTMRLSTIRFCIGKFTI